MGFILEKYTNKQAGLIVSFQGEENSNNYFAGNNINDALTYFNLYVKDNVIYLKTEEESALATIGIKTETEATILRETIDNITASFSDEQALTNKILFPVWESGVTYSVNSRVRYGNRLYKVLQAHTSQEDWTPTQAPSLFARILTNEDTGEPVAWEQPDSTNPYMYGDKVIYNGAVYESIIDNNIWSPIDYPQGWRLIETEEETPVEETIPEWVQPDSTNPYRIGDKVSYQGLIYQSTIDNNIWSPLDYPAGWALVE